MRSGWNSVRDVVLLSAGAAANSEVGRGVDVFSEDPRQPDTAAAYGHYYDGVAREIQRLGVKEVTRVSLFARYRALRGLKNLAASDAGYCTTYYTVVALVELGFAAAGVLCGLPPPCMPCPRIP